VTCFQRVLVRCAGLNAVKSRGQNSPKWLFCFFWGKMSSFGWGRLPSFVAPFVSDEPIQLGSPRILEDGWSKKLCRPLSANQVTWGGLRRTWTPSVNRTPKITTGHTRRGQYAWKCTTPPTTHAHRFRWRRIRTTSVLGTARLLEGSRNQRIIVNNPSRGLA
jgi:hypothetical protein